MDIAKSTRVGLAKWHKKKVWLAEKTSLTEQYIGQICNGKTVPPVHTISKLAVAFDVIDSEFIKWGE